MAMKARRKFYPPDWEPMRREAFERAGAVVVCEEAEGIGSSFAAALSDILTYA